MTTIEWTDESWNPLRAKNIATGGVGHFCVKVSPGCENCYSAAQQHRWKNPIRFAAQDLRLVEPFLDGKVLRKPFGWKKPKMIFPCSMTDLFADWHSDEEIDAVLAVAALTPQHIYQCLTKRAERMHDYFLTRSRSIEFWDAAARKFGYTLKFGGTGTMFEPTKPIGLCEFPLRNWQQGVSVEDPRRAEERIPFLLRAPVAKRWISYEPALDRVDFSPFFRQPECPVCGGRPSACSAVGHRPENDRPKWNVGLDWIVVGGESGRGARPFNLAWARGTVAQCRAAGVPAFVKQLGARPVDVGFEVDATVELSFKHPKGGDMSEWPEDLRVRESPQ